MSTLRDVEKSVLTLFKVSDGPDVSCSIDIVNNYGRKNKDDEKLDPVYVLSYDSKKYSNKDKLKEIRFDFKTFLVFSFLSFEDSDNIIRKEIYTSYPDLMDVMSFVEDLSDCFFGEKSEEIFRKKGKSLDINEDYKDLVIESAEFGINNEKIIVVPEITVNEETKRDEKAGIFYFGDESAQLVLGEKAIYTMICKLNDLDLTNVSLFLYTMSMLALNREGSGSDSDESSGSGRRKLKRRAVVPPRRNNSSSNFKGRGRDDDEDDRVETEEEDEDELNFQDQEEEEEVEERKPKRKATKSGKSTSKSSKKSSTKKKPKAKKVDIEEEDEEEDDGEESTSFRELMDAADEIEYDDDDEELEFDEDEE